MQPWVCVPRHLDDRKYWRLLRTCSTKLTIAAIDRFGYIVLVRDMSRLARRNRKCQEAEGLECQCACRGAHQGQNTSDWFERCGDVLIAELGEITRPSSCTGRKAMTLQPSSTTATAGPALPR
ncbi:hypothetical protein GCM10022224_005550 [Nonomuraea antimicrobica]|uniref:Uncharacterized protein n=1 Tax=Nonomuraea antimicrobica TaxID=561173 RepID=A0ABP7B290_9ACTN